MWAIASRRFRPGSGWPRRSLAFRGDEHVVENGPRLCFPACAAIAAEPPFDQMIPQESLVGATEQIRLREDEGSVRSRAIRLVGEAMARPSAAVLHC